MCAGSYGEILVEFYIQVSSSRTRRPLFPSDRACELCFHKHFGSDADEDHSSPSTLPRTERIQRRSCSNRSIALVSTLPFKPYLLLLHRGHPLKYRIDH